MALIRKFDRAEVLRAHPHNEVECTYDVFRDKNGKSYVQLSTFGSKARKTPGKQSQVIQLDEDSARQLVEIIKQTYSTIR